MFNTTFTLGGIGNRDQDLGGIPYTLKPKCYNLDQVLEYIKNIIY